MYKYVIFICALINYSLCEKSFTIVLDTTGSMKEELYIIKANIGNAIGNNSAFDDYILVTFKDSGADPPYINSKPGDLIRHVKNLTTRSGGRYCPENSLAGIETALRNSRPESYIFVFTDAYARDYDKFDTIQHLCRESHSQVIIFLRGHCSSSDSGNVEVYDAIARSCSGAFFHFDVSELNEFRQTFGFMKNITSTSWTNIETHESFNQYKQFTVSLDSYTTDFLIVATGNLPEIEVTSSYIAQNLETVLGSKNTLVSRLIQPSQGTYTITIKGNGALSTTFYERSHIPFQFGFSTRSPGDFRETSGRPIGGWNNYLLIKIDTSIELREIEWLTFGDNAIRVLYLEGKGAGYYLCSVFVEPEKTFRFWIKGRNVNTYQEIKASTKTLAPQAKESNPSWTKPIAEIFKPNYNLVNFGENITLICKVTGYPKPNITWQTDDYTFLPSEDVLLEIPNVHLSYMTLVNVTRNSTVYCKAINHEGDDTQSVDVFVNRTFTFEVLQAPQDTDVEYGSELKLYCQVDAYPEATITWHINGSSLKTFNIEDNALVVDSVGFDDNGEYVCVASNDIETKSMSAIVNIVGIEVPEIDKEETEVLLKPGDEKELECSILKGKPTPINISWNYKSFEGSVGMPSGVEINDNVLKLSNVEKKHGGIYECIATNIIGEDRKSIAVKIQHPPTIRNDLQENVTVREEDEVSLPCDVDSSPNAVVKWELLQDDVIIAFDNRHTTDKENTHHFTARSNDSGYYHCLAENNVGRAERTVFVNVLVNVYIEPPPSKGKIHATPGSNVTLQCNVLYGNPTPTIRWEFTAPNSVPRVIRGSNTKTLHLTSVSHQNEGNYTCHARNSIRFDRIKYELKVHY